MAIQNRPVVGYIQCDGCGNRATVHQAQRSTKKGLLYTRCDNCGADQRTGAAVQKRWRQQLEPQPGYEHLKEPVDEPAEEPDKPATAEPEAKPVVTEPEPTEQPKPAPKGKGATMHSPVFAGLLALGVTLLTLGAIK